MDCKPTRLLCPWNSPGKNTVRYSRGFSQPRDRIHVQSILHCRQIPYHLTHQGSSKTLATWCEELTHWKRPWCWERLRAGGEGDNRRWNAWMASLAQWTWVWANSGREWMTGKPGVLQSMGSQRVGHDSNWTTKTLKKKKIIERTVWKHRQ